MRSARFARTTRRVTVSTSLSESSHVDGEPPLKTLQRRGAGQGRLSGTQEVQAVAETLAACFDDFLNDVGSVRVIADVLLHLVQDDDGARHFAFGSERGLQRTDEFLRRDILGFGKLLAHRGSCLFLVLCKVRVRREHRIGDERTDVQIVQFHG